MNMKTSRAPAKKLGHQDRLEILDLISVGVRPIDAAIESGWAIKTVRRVIAASGGMPSRRSRRRPKSPHHLSLAEREEIRAGIAAGDSYRLIARRINRAPSTVSREVLRAGGRRRYKATWAEDLASVRSLRPKASKLAGNQRLREQVQVMLEVYLSPRQISKKLEIEFPNDPEMRISHETIYQSLYVQARGRFRKDMTAYLRTQRKKRKPQGRVETRGRIKDMINISERPAEVEDRAVPGHWEGDLIVGKGNRSFIGTLVERHTRFVMLTYLGNNATTETVCAAIAAKITELPEDLRRSLTWDQGPEMAAHASFTVKTGVPVFFCDPHSPWQRGSNENTNGLLRQFFPKGTDLSLHGPAELDRVARLMNIRPRETLNWKTPGEKMEELLLR